MRDGKQLIKKLIECEKIMETGQFDANNLTYMKKILEVLLNATTNLMEKNNIK